MQSLIIVIKCPRETHLGGESVRHANKYAISPFESNLNSQGLPGILVRQNNSYYAAERRQKVVELLLLASLLVLALLL